MCVAAAGDGFATVQIAPKISKTLGPAAVSTSLATPRGIIWSNWTRGAAAAGDGSGSGWSTEGASSVDASDPAIVALSVEVPAPATIVLPLLGRAAGAVRVTGASAGSAEITVKSAADGAEILHVEITPGRHAFEVRDR